jgi:hypothetical protein
VALRRPEAEEVEVELEVLVVYGEEVPCEAEEDAALGGRSTDNKPRWAGDWRKRGSLEVAVGDVGGLANVGEAGVGGSVSRGVGEARGTGPYELCWPGMRGLAVPPAGVLELVVPGIQNPDPAEFKIVSDATPQTAEKSKEKRRSED